MPPSLFISLPLHLLLNREQESQHPGQPEQHQRDHHWCHLLHCPHPPHRLHHCPNQAATQKVHPAA